MTCTSPLRCPYRLFTRCIDFRSIHLPLFVVPLSGLRDTAKSHIFYPHREAAAEHSVSDELLQLPGHNHDSARVHALQAVHVRHEHVLRVATTEELVLDDLVVEAVGYPGLAAPNF